MKKDINGHIIGYTIKEMKQLFKEQGCVLLEDKYINGQTKMKYKCICGNISYIRWNNFRTGQRCKNCLKINSRLGKDWTKTISQVCTRCHQEKPISEFHNSKTAGKKHYCKSCSKELLKVYLELHPRVQIWSGIQQRCRNPKNSHYQYYGGRGIQNLFKNSDEIKYLWTIDNAWNLKQPSIDRIDNDGNYCIENCRFVEIGKNIGYRNTVNSSKPVLQFDLAGNFINEYRNMEYAGKITNQTGANISNCCKGKTKTAKGFIWKFKEDTSHGR